MKTPLDHLKSDYDDGDFNEVTMKFVVFALGLEALSVFRAAVAELSEINHSLKSLARNSKRGPV